MSAPDVVGPSDGRSRLAVLGAFAAAGGAVGTWGARIPDIRADVGLSAGALGTALLGLSLGSVTGSWGGGLLVRRFGSTRVITGAWVGIGAAVVLPGLVGTWSGLAATLAVFGMALGLLDVSMNGAGIDLERVAGRPIMNGLHAGWSGGVLGGAIAGSLAVALDITPQWHLLATGALIAASGVVACPALPAAGHADGATGPGTHPPEPVAMRVRLAALAAIGACVFLAEGALLDWGGVYVRNSLDGSALLGALAATGVAGGGLLGRLLGDRLTARFGAPGLVRAGVVVSISGLGLALAVPVAAPVPVLLAFAGFGLAPAVPLAFGAAGRLLGGTGIATVTTAGYGAYLAGPAVIGTIADGIGLRAALLVPMAAMALVAPLARSTADRP